MIIVKLQGGLGNQLFQYCAGRSLALKLQTELKVDASYYNTDKKRKFELGDFNIQASLATAEEIKKLTRKNVLSKLWSFMNKRKAQKKMFDLSTHFDPLFFNLPDTTYLEGFFQNEKYFASIKDRIVEEISLKKHLDQNSGLLSSIINNNSVSVHIRRGDYTEPKYKKIFYECKPEYFYKAISLVKEKVPDPHFFVFSDDMGWAKKIAFPEGTTFISSEYGLSASNELILMSMSKHNIISNSTFSWWGAWLNQNPDKIVIAPKKWSVYQTTENNLNLPTWITI